MTFNFTFGQYQLAAVINRQFGRSKKSFNLFNFFSPLIKTGLNKRLPGNPLSRVLRHLLEKKKTRQIFAINLTAIVFLTGLITPPLSAFDQTPEVEIMAISPTVVQLTTEDTIRVPLDSFNVSQGYHMFHRAIDLKEITGVPVYPITAGVVEQIVYSRFSYGNHLLVDHGFGFKSLYAHLAKIVVVKGEKVDQNTVLGTVGTTGWATGTHLHLEIYDHNIPINPLTILK